MKSGRIKVVCVCGARPNFMKVAPLLSAFNATGRIDSRLVHTGQHYDAQMSAMFFDQLNIPRPDVNLEVGSGTHAVQTAEVMKRFEPLLVEQRPDWVVVVGDVNSTLACALVAVKLGIKVAHVEAGLRSFDRSMPEEINRLLTDAISDLLFVSEPSGVENLGREGVPQERIRFVGNVMIDTLLQHRSRAEESTILRSLGVHPGKYVTVTLHRPGNVDGQEGLTRCLDALDAMARELPVVFPVHPRTRQKLSENGLLSRTEAVAGLHLIAPLGYLDFLKLMSNSAVVLTDSGGIQEETTILGVPCLTVRPSTERPITLTHGTNRLVELDPDAILAAYRAARDTGRVREAQHPPLWDGRAAERVAAELCREHVNMGLLG